jgi:hypothetical protein
MEKRKKKEIEPVRISHGVNNRKNKKYKHRSTSTKTQILLDTSRRDVIELLKLNVILKKELGRKRNKKENQTEVQKTQK